MKMFLPLLKFGSYSRLYIYGNVMPRAKCDRALRGWVSRLTIHTIKGQLLDRCMNFV